MFVERDKVLDQATFGPRWLNDAKIAEAIETAIIRGDQARGFYELCAWVIMPNHVYILIVPRVDVAVITRWLKGSTARREPHTTTNRQTILEGRIVRSLKKKSPRV